jgi:hypothetical protein
VLQFADQEVFLEARNSTLNTHPCARSASGAAFVGLGLRVMVRGQGYLESKGIRSEK